MLFKHHDTSSTFFLESELIFTTDHTLTHLSTNLGSFDLKITIRSQLGTHKSQCHVFCRSYIFSTTYNGAISELPSIKVYQVQMIGIWMWTSRYDFCYDDLILTSYLLDTINLSCMNGIKMSEFFRSLLFEKSRYISIFRDPRKWDFHKMID